MPDIIVDFYGLRTGIEGEVDDQPNAETKAINAARKRVAEGIAHIGVAVIYPAILRSMPFADLKPQLETAELSIAIVTESQETGYAKGNLDYLERALRGAFDHLVQEDVVSRAVALLDAGIEVFAGAVLTKPGIVGRLAKTLGIRDLPSKEAADGEGDD